VNYVNKGQEVLPIFKTVCKPPGYRLKLTQHRVPITRSVKCLSAGVAAIFPRHGITLIESNHFVEAIWERQKVQNDSVKLQDILATKRLRTLNESPINIQVSALVGKSWDVPLDIRGANM